VPQWLKTLVMLVVLLAWLAVVTVTLLRGQLPDAAVLGIPAAVVIALAPPVAIGRRPRRRTPRRTQGEEPDGEAE